MRSGLSTQSPAPYVVLSLLVALAAFALGRFHPPEPQMQLSLYLGFAWTLLLALGVSFYGAVGGWILLGAPLARHLLAGRVDCRRVTGRRDGAAEDRAACIGGEEDRGEERVDRRRDRRI